MQFIRVQTANNDIWNRTEKEMREIVRHMVRAMGIEQARNELKIEIVDLKVDKNLVYDILNSTHVEGTVVGEYYITPRGGVKRDRDDQ